MKCPYCSEEIRDDARKCRFCGEWLDSSAATRESTLAARRMDGNGVGRLVAWLFVIAVVLVAVYAPVVPVNVTYSEVESYERPIKYQVVSASISRALLSGCLTPEVTIKNVDKHDGTFTVTSYLYVHDVCEETKEARVYIVGRGGSGTCRLTFNTKITLADWVNNWGTKYKWYYRVQPPTVIDQRVVSKSKMGYKTIIRFVLDSLQEPDEKPDDDTEP